MIGRFVHRLNNLPLWCFMRSARTILDVGCGVNSPVNYFVKSSQNMEGLDVCEHDLALQKKTKYSRIHVSDIRDFRPSEMYDLVTALDFIEHFTKDDGWKLLDQLERIGRRVILVTPNGFIPQLPDPNNPFQEHKSGWTADEFRSRGYRVYGMFGPKWLRKETAILRWQPRIIWCLVAWVLAPFYFYSPQRSFSLMAVFDRKSDV